MKLNELISEVTENGYHVCEFSDLYANSDIDVESKAGRLEFNQLLDEANLQILPKIVNGSVANLERSILGIPIVFYHRRPAIDRHTSRVRYALLVGRISAVLAKVDGEVDPLEVTKIKSKIYDFSFLTESEKYDVFVRSIYSLYLNSSKDRLLHEFAKLNESEKLQVISIIKSIIIADKQVHRSERLILAEFYRLTGIPTNTVAKDLREFAKERKIELANNNTIVTQDEDVVINCDNTLDEMLSEFEVF
ncbi:hypothetical protein L4C54_03835 [Vibrio lamellibrachiae]|uniref:hypothetical protein n=1 Tax=Vibrio lamellibrachiae TaxID=2910253 RepID=UPI003D0CA3F7